MKGRAVSQQAQYVNTYLVVLKEREIADLLQSLGDERVVADVSVSHVRYINPYDKPFAVFNFRYRSRSGLEALGLIAALEDRPIESLSNEELRELVKRQQVGN